MSPDPLAGWRLRRHKQRLRPCRSHSLPTNQLESSDVVWETFQIIILISVIFYLFICMLSILLPNPWLISQLNIFLRNPVPHLAFGHYPAIEYLYIVAYFLKRPHDFPFKPSFHQFTMDKDTLNRTDAIKLKQSFLESIFTFYRC